MDKNFIVQFGNKLTLVGFTTNSYCIYRMGSCTFVNFWIAYSCKLLLNLTHSRVITYVHVVQICLTVVKYVYFVFTKNYYRSRYYISKSRLSYFYFSKSCAAAGHIVTFLEKKSCFHLFAPFNHNLLHCYQNALGIACVRKPSKRQENVILRGVNVKCTSKQSKISTEFS